MTNNLMAIKYPIFWNGRIIGHFAVLSSTSRYKKSCDHCHLITCKICIIFELVCKLNKAATSSREPRSKTKRSTALWRKVCAANKRGLKAWQIISSVSRYNAHEFCFKGKLPLALSTWAAARVQKSNAFGADVDFQGNEGRRRTQLLFETHSWYSIAKRPFGQIFWPFLAIFWSKINKIINFDKKIFNPLTHFFMILARARWVHRLPSLTLDPTLEFQIPLRVVLTCFLLIPKQVQNITCTAWHTPSSFNKFELFSRVPELLARWLQKPRKVAVNSTCEYRHISHSFYDKGKTKFNSSSFTKSAALVR